jgi:hypothetical protein
MLAIAGRRSGDRALSLFLLPSLQSQKNGARYFLFTAYVVGDGAPRQAKRFGSCGQAQTVLPTPLHGSGVPVLVPAPERYAVHKLILSVRRRIGTAKRDKDLHQAQMLIEPLLEKRPRELAAVWEEAFARGQTWRQLLLDGMSRLEPDVRDVLLKALKRTRKILPGINLTFDGSDARYDSTREVVTFTGEALGHSVRCSVSREALEDSFGANNLDRAGRLEAFHKNRSEIEGMIRTMYLTWPVETVGSVLLTTPDVERLRKPPTRAKS